MGRITLSTTLAAPVVALWMLVAGCGSAQVVAGTGESSLVDFDDPDQGGALLVLRDTDEPYYVFLGARVRGLSPGDPSAPDGDSRNPVTRWTIRDGGTILASGEVQRGYTRGAGGTYQLVGIRVDLSDTLSGPGDIDGHMLDVELEVIDADGETGRDRDDVEARAVSVELGTGDAFDWVDFDDNGNELIVHMGPQGGFHTFLSVRSRWLDPGDPAAGKGDEVNPVVEWRLYYDDGTEIGARDLQVGLLPGPDDYYQRIAVAVILDTDLIISPTEVDGRTLVIEMTVTDTNGISSSTTRQVTAVGVVG